MLRFVIIFQTKLIVSWRFVGIMVIVGPNWVIFLELKSRKDCHFLMLIKADFIACRCFRRWCGILDWALSEFSLWNGELPIDMILENSHVKVHEDSTKLPLKGLFNTLALIQCRSCIKVCFVGGRNWVKNVVFLKFRVDISIKEMSLSATPFGWMIQGKRSWNGNSSRSNERESRLER